MATKLTPAMRAVLERGECILFLDNHGPVDVTYGTWAALCARKFIRHKRSNLDAKRPWERYVATPAGLSALKEQEKGE